MDGLIRRKQRSGYLRLLFEDVIFIEIKTGRACQNTDGSACFIVLIYNSNISGSFCRI